MFSLFSTWLYIVNGLVCMYIVVSSGLHLSSEKKLGSSPIMCIVTQATCDVVKMSFNWSFVHIQGIFWGLNCTYPKMLTELAKSLHETRCRKHWECHVPDHVATTDLLLSQNGIRNNLRASIHFQSFLGEQAPRPPQPPHLRRVGLVRLANDRKVETSATWRKGQKG